MESEHNCVVIVPRLNLELASVPAIARKRKEDEIIEKKSPGQDANEGSNSASLFQDNSRNPFPIQYLM